MADLSRRALSDLERGLGERDLEIEEEALDRMADSADGDARRALNALDGLKRDCDLFDNGLADGSCVDLYCEDSPPGPAHRHRAGRARHCWSSRTSWR